MNLPTATSIVPFHETLKHHQLTFSRTPPEILQINCGKLCNQACRHCHVDAGPARLEVMTRETIDRLLTLLAQTEGIHTVDITGGAPELNPHFRTLVQESRRLGKEVIDRCNLTVLLEKGQEDTAHFLKQQQVQIIASLPCYSQKNVDQQRGNGTFDKSIKALRLLNQIGYGTEAGGLTLHLVYNPIGALLPPQQDTLETDYKERLKRLFGIDFNRLLTLTNMPIKRFLDELIRTGQLDEYMILLASSFNPQAARNVMCQNLVSVSWEGQIYDCDFNQMLEIPIARRRMSIWDINTFDELATCAIAVDDHCYGCTAGVGSSCSGALV